jgi:predicted permease
MRQLRFAARMLSRTPFVTGVAVASLALGIGANTAIFSLFYQVLLRPPPVADPGTLVNFSAPGPKPGSTSCGAAGDCEDVFSYRMFRDLEAQSSDVLNGFAAHVFVGVNLAHRDQKLSGTALVVSGSYFPTLRIQPALGRLLSPADDQAIGSHFVTVLSHRFWSSQLGSDSTVLNSPIVVNGQSYTIVGVAPEGFDGTTFGELPHVFVPLTMRGVVGAGWNDFENRRAYWAYVFGRLKPGVSMQQAGAALGTRYRQIINDVEAPLQEDMSAQTMARFRAKSLLLEDGRRGQSDVHEEATTPLALLFAVTGIVLLIACANVANLLLARGAQRSSEMAVRLSLGARRGQLLRQLLTESFLLAAMAGVVSIVVARATLGLIVSFLPPDAQGVIVLRLEGWVLIFAALLALGTGLVFGLFPALQSTRPDLLGVIKSGSGKTSVGRPATRFRSALVATQMALSMALLVCAALFLRSLFNVTREDLGLEPDKVLTFYVSPLRNGYNTERRQVFFRRVQEELSTLPGVAQVTAARVGLLAGNNWGTDVRVEGFQRDPDTDANANWNLVGPGYFNALGMTVLMGREFTPSDVVGAPKVAVVNETFAKKFGLGRDVVGKRMSRGDEELDLEIVGLVKDAKYSEVKNDVPPLFFVPFVQDTTVGGMNYYVRAAGQVEGLMPLVPAVIEKLDPDLPVEGLKTLPQQIRENVFLDRMISTFSAAFALLATFLAAVGLYGVLAYSVTQRTNEIGVRMALGADASRVHRLVLGQVARLTAIGGVIGTAGALGLGKAAESILFGVQGYDPLAIAGALVVLALVAAGAGYVPARRASRVLPMKALRYE